MVRYNQRWDEIDKSRTSLESLFESYALFNRSDGKAGSTSVFGTSWAQTLACHLVSRTLPPAREA